MQAQEANAQISTTHSCARFFNFIVATYLDYLGMNSTAMENLGQSLHTFQDVEAHRGAVFRATTLNGKGFFSINGNAHKLHNDTNPEPTRFGIAQFFTGNAILVHQIMSGNFKRLTNGTQISTQGMNTSQIDNLKSKIKSAGFEFTRNGGKTYMYSVKKKG